MIQIRDILPDSISINSYFTELYGIEVISKSEGDNPFFVLDDLNGLVMSLKTKSKQFMNKFVFIAITRNKVKTKDYPDFYKTRMFLFTFDKGIYQTILQKIKDSGKALSGIELAKAVIDCSTLLCGYELKGKRLERNGINIEDSDAYNLVSIRNINVAIEEAFRYVEKKYGYDLFVGYHFSNRSKDLLSLSKTLSTKWEGTLWIAIDFNDLGGILKRRRLSFSNSPEKYKTYSAFIERYNSNELILAGVSTYLVIKGIDEDNKAIADESLSSLGFNAYPKAVNKMSIIRETPLKRRDYDFLAVAKTETLAEYFSSSFEKTYVPKDIDIFGISMDKEFVSYSFKEEGVMPHSVIVAPTNSGKSFSIQKVITQILDIDIKHLTENAEEIGKDKKINANIRWFDIGFSAKKLNELLKLRGYNVEIASPYPENFKYNPVEVEVYEDIEFSVEMINLILALKGEEKLTANEEAYFRKYLEIFLKDKSKIPSLSNPISVLKDFLSEEKAYSRALELGYDPLTSKLIDLKEPEFKRFHNPLIDDVISFANEDAFRGDISEEEREILQSLISKLSSVSAISYFSSYSNVDVKSPEYVYYELSLLKEIEVFPAIAVGIIWKVYKADIQKERDIKKVYIFDEFHNYNRLKGEDSTNLEVRSHINKIFSVMMREGRRYNVRLMFISQSPKDFDDTILSNAGSKIILSPAYSGSKEGEGANFLNEVKERFNFSEELMNKIRSMPRYHWCLVYPSGYFTLTFPILDIEKQLYNSEVTEVVLPTGEVISV